MAKKKKNVEEAEHENSERWLLTYADMITLLVCFFIIMYSMSVMNLKKFDKVAISIRSGFGGRLEGGKGTYVAARANTIFGEGHGRPGVSEVSHLDRERKKLQYVGRQLALLRLDRVLEPIVDVSFDEGNCFRVILSDQLFFAPNCCDVDQETRERILTLGQYLKDVPSKITVEGYSGPVPDDDSDVDSWTISAGRARAIIDVLTRESGVNPRRLVLRANGERTLYSSSRRLVLTASGEWKELSSADENDNTQDRVIVWILIE